ncbi:hypothetical protein HHL16_03970 [Pseudoflavitalea sp. G-6-1-2]|uniref:hypothetical protein n=1 Tax=Pseudoflavitalea sp. G-6-1-2 TaxID=2728841 RepID=UPI00146B59EE|nr:hypothetical protein [Pseudoflavitalea sp. G-6-1-2]NML20015.1 hypothetical protein [Pseudoflavitalea sp. G-6-1-2]
MKTICQASDSHQPSIQELENTLKIAAKVVAMYGEVYLTGFLRLQKEIEVAKEAHEARSVAIALAREIAGA